MFGFVFGFLFTIDLIMTVILIGWLYHIYKKSEKGTSFKNKTHLALALILASLPCVLIIVYMATLIIISKP